MSEKILPIIQVGDVLVSPDILTECFCCDYEKCKGVCCVEGDAGAPVTLDEIAGIEGALDAVWSDLSASAQAVIDRQGVAYTDREGDLVTSIVGGKDCVFTCYGHLSAHTSAATADDEDGKVCMCALEKAYRAGRTSFVKPVSCALYPIREKRLSNGMSALNYNRWDVCRDAVVLGRRLSMPVWKFLKAPLVRRFGEAWYAELEQTVAELEAQGLLQCPEPADNEQ
ncbi:MAG: DUF3109 family protein [Prevotella sp.]|nr:DUF3109 family protein [Prevotella sp.]